MRPVLDYLRQSGFHLIGFVDDHGAAAPGCRPVSKADAAEGSGFGKELYDRLGLSLHPEKGNRDGTQQLTLLGYTLDTANNQVRLPESRLAKLRGTAAALLSSARKTRRWVRRKLLQSAAGIIVSGSLAIPKTRLFAKSIYDKIIWRGLERRLYGSRTSRSGIFGSGRPLASTATADRCGQARRPTPCTPTSRGTGGVASPTASRRHGASSRGRRSLGTST